VHGSGGDRRDWTAQERRFERAVYLDLPGHPTGSALRSAAEVADALAPLVAAVDGPRAIVGHSLGGAVALELARRHPDLVDGLVLLASGARLPVPDRVMAGLRDDFAAECERVIAASYLAGPSRDAARHREAMHAAGPAALEADYAACAGFDARGALGEVRAPALVIAAGEDVLTPPWLSEELTRELPLAQMALVPGVGHAVMAEGAGAVNLLLAAYLARLELTLDGI